MNNTKALNSERHVYLAWLSGANAMSTPLHLAKRHGEGGVRFLKPSGGMSYLLKAELNGGFNGNYGGGSIGEKSRTLGDSFEMSSFHVGGKVVDKVDLCRKKHWAWPLDVWPFAILYATWLATIVPNVDFIDAMIGFGDLLASHILVLLFTMWSVDFKCFIQFSKVNSIIQADAFKVTPAKFSDDWNNEVLAERTSNRRQSVGNSRAWNSYDLIIGIGDDHASSLWIKVIIIIYPYSVWLSFTDLAMLLLNKLNVHIYMADLNANAKITYEDASDASNDAVQSIRTFASFFPEEKGMKIYTNQCEGPKFVFSLLQRFHLSSESNSPLVASMSKNPAKSQPKLQLNRPPVPWIRKKGLLGSIYSFESCKKKDSHRA
ncbi:hypothetical protein YC2023_093792 [Brassica napus]